MKEQNKTAEKMNKDKLLKELSKFTGTQKYYKSTFGRLKLTDGIDFLRNEANCYWLIDIIESYQDKLRNTPFQIWTLKVNPDKSAVVACKEDTGQPNLIEQKLEYTDFPLDEIEVYCIDGVVLLPSEY